MKPTLLLLAASKMAAGLALMGLLLFLPAGTFAYPGAWRLLGALFVMNHPVASPGSPEDADWYCVMARKPE